MVSVLHNELEYKVKKFKYKMSEVIQLRIKNKAELPVGEVNHPGSVHTKFYSRDWLIQFQHLSVKNDKEEGGGSLKERGAY